MSRLNISKNQGFRPMLRQLSFHLSKQTYKLKMEKKDPRQRALLQTRETMSGLHSGLGFSYTTLEK